MLIISHRGNLHGRDKGKENHPDYILQAIEYGFDVEVDVWLKNNNLFLGHDKPQYKINLKFLKNKKLWCHAKNFEAFSLLFKEKIHVFWHEKDKFTLTSKNIIWCYPNNYMPGGITVCLKYKQVPSFIKGVCTDYPKTFKTNYENSGLFFRRNS